MSLVCTGGSDRPPRTALGPRVVIWTELNPPVVVRPAIGTDQLPQRTLQRARYSEQAACQARSGEIPGVQRVARTRGCSVNGRCPPRFCAVQNFDSLTIPD